MRVVFVMIDGLRPDALDLADTPTLHAIMARASSSSPTIIERSMFLTRSTRWKMASSSEQ